MPGAVHAVTEYKELLARTEELIREFRPRLSAGAVIRMVVSCRDQLVRTGVRRGLATATEAMARSRLLGTIEPNRRAVGRRLHESAR